jgi:hypothetical protein
VTFSEIERDGMKLNAADHRTDNLMSDEFDERDANENKPKRQK